MTVKIENTKLLREVAKGGRIVVLGDKSMWEISPDSRQNTWFWNLTSKIAVSSSDNPSYPYRLVNQDKNDAIEGRFLGVMKN
jgi:hypothetical protein